MLNLIIASGYGWSGSSACTDLLKEFDGMDGINNEFRIIKDPNGLIDLESALIDNWEFIRHDVAIRDFLSYCDVLSRGANFFSKNGKGFSEKLSVDFKFLCEEYILSLMDLKYKGNTFVHRYNLSRLHSIIMRIKSKLKIDNYNNMNLSRPSRDKFIKETRKLVNDLFLTYAHKNQLHTIVLHQAISPSNIKKSLKYCDNVKLILVDRDPRDIYMDMVELKVLLGVDLSSNESAENYILWHKLLREKNANNANNVNVLNIKFEDLIMDYNNQVSKIVDFCGIKSNHSRNKQLFDPEVSRKNIGIWRDYKNQNVMRKIGDAFNLES